MTIDQLESAEREGSHMQAKVITIGSAPGYRDMQITVDHSDPKTTASYDRRDRSPHGHPAMTLAGLYAAAA